MKHVPITRAELVSLINENRATKLKVKEAIVVSEIFLAALERKEQEMLAKYEQLERIDALIDNLKARIKAMVLLNLRGKVFAIESQFLLSDTLWCSYFPVMLLNEPDPTSGEYFIDCASEGFDRILDCARSGSMNCNLQYTDAFEIGSINRNLLYLRLPYRCNEYHLVNEFDAIIGERHFLSAMIQLQDGRLMTTSHNFGEKSELRIWNTTTFHCERTIIANYNIDSLLQLKDGRLCCGCSSTKYIVLIEVWDLDTGLVVRSFFGPTYAVKCLIQLADDRLCTGGKERMLMLWNVKSKESLDANAMKVATLHVNTIGSLIQLSSGLVATGSIDGVIKLWNPISWECVRTIWLAGPGSEAIHLLEIEDGIIVSCWGTSFKFFEVGTGVLQRSILHGENYVCALVKLNNRRLLCANGMSVKIMILETEEWEEILESDHCKKLLQLENGRLLTSFKNTEWHTLVNVWSPTRGSSGTA